MAERRRVKITVLKRFKPSEVFQEPPVTHIVSPRTGAFEACEVVRDGQEFMVGEDGNRPEGFCTSAWASIYPNVRMLSFGGDLPFYKEKGVAVSCCIDGLRPVVFKLERI